MLDFFNDPQDILDSFQPYYQTAELADVSDPNQDARRGRYYELRPAGRTALEAELQRLNRVIEYARAQNLLTDLEPSA